MGKKDYELIARIIKGLPLPPADRVSVVINFASAFDVLSDKFNKSKFVRACFDEAEWQAATHLLLSSGEPS